MQEITAVLGRPPTVILSQRFSSDSNDVWSACHRRGWNTHRAIRYAPPEDTSLCCVYGEILVCDIMAERAGLSLLDPPDSFLPSLPRDALGRDVRLVELKDLRSFRERAFFKPANDKVFQAGVYERGSDVPVRHVDPRCPVLVSDVVSFTTEFRCHVLDRSIVNVDHYRLIEDLSLELDPDLYEDKCRTDAVAFARRVLDSHGHLLPSSVVLDVGRLDGGGMAVVEANQVYSSGLYGNGHVANGILDCILRASGPSSLVRDSDRPFVRAAVNL